MRLVIWSALDRHHHPLGTFRVTEEGRYADSQDHDYLLPAESTQIGIPWPHHLSQTPAWQLILSDYQLIPLFPHLYNFASPDQLQDRGRFLVEGRCLQPAMRRILFAQQQYRMSDARFDAARLVNLAAELLIRMRAVVSAQGTVPQLFLRGSSSAKRTPLGSAHFTGLGSHVAVKRKSIVLAVPLQDVTTGTELATVLGELTLVGLAHSDGVLLRRWHSLVNEGARLGLDRSLDPARRLAQVLADRNATLHSDAQAAAAAAVELAIITTFGAASV